MQKLNKIISTIPILATLLAGGCTLAQTQTPVTPIPTLPAIDTFFDESYKQLLLRDPEAVTELALSKTFGAGNNQLTDISDAYIRQTQAI